MPEHCGQSWCMIARLRSHQLDQTFDIATLLWAPDTPECMIKV